MIEINVFAEGDSWLFGDLKRHFANTQVTGVRVTTSHLPLDTADIWIAIRTHEAARVPDKSRTIACIHDCYDHDEMYAAKGIRGVVHKVGGLVLSHPLQRDLLRSVNLNDKIILERPLGALSIFSPGAAKPPGFRIGWVGRNHWRKRLDWFMKTLTCTNLTPQSLTPILVGKDLHDMVQALENEGFTVEHYPRDNFPVTEYPTLYQRMNLLLITSTTEAGPLTLFEALASGTPVVTTSVGWGPILHQKAPDLIRLGDSPAELATHVEAIFESQAKLNANRHQIAEVVADAVMDRWFEDVLQLAKQLHASKQEAAN